MVPPLDFILLALIPAIGILIPLIVKGLKNLQKPAKEMAQLRTEFTEFKMKNRFNREELLNDLRFNILEKHKSNSDKIIIIERELFRIEEQCKLLSRNL